MLLLARIDEGAFKYYEDGKDRMTAQEYMRDREILRLTVNDLEDKYENIEDIRETFVDIDSAINQTLLTLRQGTEEFEQKTQNLMEKTEFKSEIGVVYSHLKNHSFLFQPKTGIVAHRGARVNSPENTLKAIEQAGRLGYEIVELDVIKTKDGVLVLMHDSTLDRTTNGTGRIDAFTKTEIDKLVIDEAYPGKLPEEIIRIPSFEEACQECQKWGLGINVDCSKMTWDTPTIVETFFP